MRFPRSAGWIPLAALLAVVLVSLTVFLIRAAETPFGVGNGQLPGLVGRDLCSATRALSERDLRRRYAGRREVFTEALHGSRQDSFDCSGDEVVRHAPAAGTALGQGGIVTLITECTDPAQAVGCV